MATAESFTLLSLVICVVALRSWWRWSQVGFSSWELDDYLMPFSAIIFSVITTLAYLVGAQYDGLTNSYMTEDQRAALDPNSLEAYNRMMGSKIQVIGWSLYVMELWLLKCCVASFYSRLTIRLTNLRLRLRIGYFIVGITYMITALCVLLGCQPFQHYWQSYPDPGELCQPTSSRLNVLAVLLNNVCTDIYLMSIPLPLLWKVNISLRRKLSLMVLFSGAIFVITAATIRAGVILTAGESGAVLGSEWACREIFVGVVVTNLPIIQPLLRQIARNVGLSVLFSRSAPSGNKNYPLGSKDGPRGYSLSKFTGNKSTAVAQNLPTHTAAWASDDHILYDGKNNNEWPSNIMVAQEVSVVSESAADTKSIPVTESTKKMSSESSRGSNHSGKS